MSESGESLQVPHGAGVKLAAGAGFGLVSAPQAPSGFGCLVFVFILMLFLHRSFRTGLWKPTVFPPLASISGAGQQMSRTAVKGGTRRRRGEDLDGQRHLLKLRPRGQGRENEEHATRNAMALVPLPAAVMARLASRPRVARESRCAGRSKRNRKAHAAVTACGGQSTATSPSIWK